MLTNSIVLNPVVWSLTSILQEGLVLESRNIWLGKKMPLHVVSIWKEKTDIWTGLLTCPDLVIAFNTKKQSHSYFRKSAEAVQISLQIRLYFPVSGKQHIWSYIGSYLQSVFTQVWGNPLNRLYSKELKSLSDSGKHSVQRAINIQDLFWKFYL